MHNNKRIGLALSGGGYRAAAYHLGTLRKLHDLGILDKIDVISAVSGGSIIAASYGLNKKDFPSFEKEFQGKLKESVIKRVILSRRFVIFFLLLIIALALIITGLFTSIAWLSFAFFIISIAFIIKFQFLIFPVSVIIEKVYDKIFYKKATLADLCNSPIIALNSTNLDTGRLFTFSCEKMSDSLYEYRKDTDGNDLEKIEFIPDNFPIAKAVTASSCVPFAFTPVSISQRFYKHAEDYKKIKPALIDGGVYDNQGIHKLTHSGSTYECDIIIVSDAGNKFPEIVGYQNTISLLIRTSDLFMNRIKNFQMFNNLFNKNNTGRREVAYQSLGWDSERCIAAFVEDAKKGIVLDTTILALGLDSERVKNMEKLELETWIKEKISYKDLKSKFLSKVELEIARNVSTNLTALSEKEIMTLSQHAALLTEIQVKLYCPFLID